MLLTKEIDFVDVLLQFNNYIKNEDADELDNYMSDLIDRLKVIPMVNTKEKQAALLDILTRIETNSFGAHGDVRVDELAVQVELLYTLKCLELYTNISVGYSIGTEYFTVDLYDMVIESGLWDNILDVAENDMISFHNLLSDSISWHNIINLINSIGKFDSKSIDNLIQEIRLARKDLSEDAINKLTMINDYNASAVNNLSAAFTAGIINSMDTLTDEQRENWLKHQDLMINLDDVLTQQNLDSIIEDVNEYFKNQDKMAIDRNEIIDVYEYLKSKNRQAVSQIDFELSEENKRTIQNGVTTKIIKLLSKKQALENKFKKDQELLELADNIMSLDNQSTDELKEILINLKNKKK